MQNQTKNTTHIGINTRLAHMGHNPRDYHGFINPPVVHASTVLFPDVDTMVNHSQKYTYGTRGTPTTDALADALTELENAAGTVLVPSGLAAISVPLLAFAKSGDHILMVDSLYQPSRQFCDNVLQRMGVEVEYFSPSIGEGLEQLTRKNTSVVFLEAPGSNTFEMCDIPLLSEIAHRAGAVVMMDNTWATPLFFKPLDNGVDISIHALTKYPAGHSDLVLGSVSANEPHFEQLLQTHGDMGICGSPDDCYLTLRSLRTMGIRLQHHQKSALKIAQWLNNHTDVAKVLHPALPDDPGHTLWKRDFTGSSGLFGFVFKDYGFEQAAAFLDALEIFGLGYSWAGFESLALMPNLSDRVIAMEPKEGKTIRLQIGLEDVPDLIADLERGFTAAAKA